MNEDSNNPIIVKESKDAWPEQPIVPALPNELTIRTATARDVEFIDQMQKLFQGQLGFLWKSVIEKRVAEGEVRLAVDAHNIPYGLCMAASSYMSRDDVGVIFQLAVVPIKHRKKVGAALVRDFFDNAPYGMKLCCCWCAQDLQANYFWEAMGFIPLAFRTGSRTKQRVHIFWERRVRRDDTTTPFWFPSKTTKGTIAEDRIVLPIPPGTSWRDAKPAILPGIGQGAGVPLLPNGLPDLSSSTQRPRRALPVAKPAPPAKRRHSATAPPGYVRVPSSRGAKLILVDPELARQNEPPKPKRKRKTPPVKIDKGLLSKARELRDRYLDIFNASSIVETGKYNPARLVDDSVMNLRDVPSLPEK